MIQYFHRLWLLLRAWRGNPLIAVTVPWRGPARRRWIFWGLVLLTWGVAPALAAWMRWRDPSHAWSLFYRGAAITIPLVTALSLHVFGYRHREDTQLQELALTRLSRTEAAFGAVFWGVVASALLSFPVILGFGITACHLIEVCGFDTAVLAILWVASAAAAVRSAILAFGRLGHVLVYTGAVAGALFLVANVQMFLDAEGVILAILAVIALYVVVQAGQFAGLRFFAPLDWEALCRAYWLTNELVALFEFDERRAAMKQLRSRTPARIPTLLLSWMGGAAVLWVSFSALDGLARLSPPPFPYPPICRLGDPTGVILALTAAAWISLAVRLWSQKGRLWVAGGSIHVSILAQILPSAVPFLVILTAAGVHGQAHPEIPMGAGRFFAAAALGVFLSTAMGLGLLRIRPSWAALALGALVWFLTLTAFLYGIGVLGTFPYSGQLPNAPVSSGFGRSAVQSAFSWEVTLHYSLALFSLLLLAFWSSACQAIHRRHLSNIPRHTLVAVP